MSFAPIVQYPPLTAAVLYTDQPIKLDHLWAGLCVMGAVFFIFRT
jgi:uncharacterized protein (DUF486 family)